jgi:homoserine dehydrogenase
MTAKKELGIALVGCGTVGGGVAKMLVHDAEVLQARIKPRLKLRYIIDVNFETARSLNLDENLFCTDLDTALADPKVEVVVELVGGTAFARQLTEKALRAGKHVVTANKALLAHHGAELWALARENGVTIAFEASCAGGIPIIRALCDGLIANRIDALYGIVNGTCNYILTAMTLLGQSYAEALAEAQQAGLAEADPTLDVTGGDSSHKLAILASLAFGQKVNLEKIPVSGIDQLDLRDLDYGQELGYVVKLLAIAERQRTADGEEGLSLSVRPAFIVGSHPLAWVSESFNAVSVFGHATGHTMYYGRGAGRMPTASAVVADLASIATGTAQCAFEQLNLWPDQCEPAHQLPFEVATHRYYIRATCEDHPGVLAKIAATLGKYNISISSVLQHEPICGEEDSGVPVIITTAAAVEGNIQKALSEIDAMDCIKASSVCIAIVDEYPELID